MQPSEIIGATKESPAVGTGRSSVPPVMCVSAPPSLGGWFGEGGARLT